MEEVFQADRGSQIEVAKLVIDELIRLGGGHVVYDGVDSLQIQNDQIAIPLKETWQEDLEWLNNLRDDLLANLSQRIENPEQSAKDFLRQKIKVYKGDYDGSNFSLDKLQGDLAADFSVAALRIQSVFKGYRTRKRLPQKNPQPETIQEEQINLGGKDAAATTIQSVWRRHVARKVAKDLRQKKAQDDREAAEASLRREQEAAAAEASHGASSSRPKVDLDLKAQHAAAIKFQSYFRGRKARRDLAKKQEAATTIQKVFRGYKVRKTLQKSDGENLPELSEEKAAAIKLQSAFRRLMAMRQLDRMKKDYLGKIIKIQANIRRFLAARRAAEKRADDQTNSVTADLRPSQDLSQEKVLKDLKEADPKSPDRDEAARKIQEWWRRRRAEKLLREKGMPTKFETKYIDTWQLTRELETDYYFDPEKRTFRKRKKGDSNWQGAFLPEICGYYDKGVKGLDKNTGTSFDEQGNPITDGKVKESQFVLDEMGRSSARPKDIVEFGPDGLPIARYDNLARLQKHVDNMRHAQMVGSMPKAPNPFVLDGDIKVALAQYPSEDGPKYAVVIQTKEATSLVLANKGVVEKKIEQAKEAFDNKENREKLFVEALVACSDIADENKRMTVAAKMVRQQIRDQMMRQIAQEVERAQEKNKTLHQLDERDLAKMANSAGLVGDGAKDMADKIKLGQQQVPLAVNPYSGWGVSKNMDGAVVDVRDPNPRQFMVNLPGTSLYYSVFVAHKGKNNRFVNGNLQTFEAQEGQVCVDENTAHYYDGKNFVPLRIHGPTFGTQPNSLANHRMLRYQAGPKGYKALQKRLDDFTITVHGNFGENRSVAYKAKGVKTVSTMLDPVGYRDKNDNVAEIAKKLPDIQKISDAVAEPAGKQEVFVRLPFVDLVGVGNKNVQNDAVNEKLRKKGPVFAAVRRVDVMRVPPSGDLRDRLAGDDVEKIVPSDPQYRDRRKWQVVDKQNGLCREKAVYRQTSDGSYEKLTMEVLMSELNDGKDPILSVDEAKIYARRFLEQLAVESRAKVVVNSEAEKKEQQLRHACSYGKVADAQKLIEELKARKAAVEAALPDASSEERWAALGKCSFNINAVDKKTGKTALHYAVEAGNEDLVRDLIAAGANPSIRDIGGKTPYERGKKSGKFNANNSVLDDLKKEEKKYEVRQAEERVKEAERNFKVLSARFNQMEAKETQAVQRYVDAANKASLAASAFANATLKGVAPQELLKLENARDLAQKNAAGAKSAFEKVAAQRLALHQQAMKAARDLGRSLPDDHLTPTPDKYERITHIVKIDAVGNDPERFVEVFCYVAKEPNCVVARRNAKGEVVCERLPVGEVAHDETVRFVGSDGQYVGNVAVGKVVGPMVLSGNSSNTPAGWNGFQWNNVRREMRNLDNDLKDFEKLPPAIKAAVDAALKAQPAKMPIASNSVLVHDPQRVRSDMENQLPSEAVLHPNGAALAASKQSQNSLAL